MGKEKVTLTLDAERLAELRAQVGTRSLSAGVDAAIAAYLDRLTHQLAVDEWLAQMQASSAPAPTGTWDWATRLTDECRPAATRGAPRRAS
ncbi:MAG: hypothetical protein ACRDTG_12760 [Pseudonocardiaceae bacterium]